MVRAQGLCGELLPNGNVCIWERGHRAPHPEPQLALTLDTATHMLADLDQIVTEMEMNLEQRPADDWLAMLRHAVDGEDYKR